MITIDQTGRIPIYEQICKNICQEISKGILKEGDKLPSARVLAKELLLNPNTVAKAYNRLEHDGIIYSVAGKGCFVSNQKDGVEKKLTDEFREKAVEVINAGISPQTLIEIINQISNQKGEKNND